VEGTFLSASAERIPTSFFCNAKGCLDEGFYLPDALQSLFPPFIGHQRACHKVSIHTFHNLSRKK
jgi:hypothetical protein